VEQHPHSPHGVMLKDRDKFYVRLQVLRQLKLIKCFQNNFNVMRALHKAEWLASGCILLCLLVKGPLLNADQSSEVHDGEEIIPTSIPKTENCNLTAQFVSSRSTDRYVTLALLYRKVVLPLRK